MLGCNARAKTGERSRRSRRRLMIVGLFVLIALALAGSALASYYWVGNLGVGGYASTAGWNNRDYNRACWDGSGMVSYPVAVAYFNTGMVRVNYSGTVYTHCGDGLIARLENDGYFLSRCYNNYGDTLWIVCQTTP